MKAIKKILKTLSILMVVGLVLLPASFTFATNVDRELTDRENAAFIVRDEWTTWVKGFTASLSELDKNATSRIYTNMDYYDMQYRFTEKYKKVPEYLDEDGKPTQKLKDLIKEKRKEINGATTTREFLCFTSNTNGSTVKYTQTGSPTTNIGYSTDGTTFITWAKDTPITLNSGESIYVWNKNNTLNNSSNYIKFVMSGSIAASGPVDSMINFSSITSYCYSKLFQGCTVLTKAPELPATTLANDCYSNMFDGCTSLTDAPSELPAITLANQCYYAMFNGCNQMQVAPYIKATTLASGVFNGMFSGCTSLREVSIDYTGSFMSTLPDPSFGNWLFNAANNGTLYYSGTSTDAANINYIGLSGKSWTITPHP